MNHLGGLETVELPDEFSEALLADASCEAVLVEATVPGDSVGPMDRPGLEAPRRGSVALFRVGRAYVAEIVAGSGPTRTVGLAPADALRYIDLVDRDDEWTVLSVEGALSASHRDAGDTEAAAGR